MAHATSYQESEGGCQLGPMPSGEGLRQLVPGRLAGRMLTALEGGMVGCGQMRCWARLSWSLLMLCLTAVGVKVQAAADEGATAR